MIEYDKANVTSSYPSLTKYEVATILDKAYLALIARKLTGNNTRRVPFEYDVKAIEDLRPLITSKIVNTSTATTTASNELAFKLPDDLLYYLEGQASYTNDNSETADNKDHFNEIVNLVDHRTAQRFRATNTNMPWIKQPVSFLQGDDVYVLYDTYKHHDPLSLLVTYLEKPASFVASLVGTEDEPGGNPGGNEPGGGESGSDTNKYVIKYKRKPLTVYNTTQMASYSATASNNTTTSEVSFSVVSGSEYAYIQQDVANYYNLIVKPAATSTKTVKLRATCVNDTSVYEEFDVSVTYQTDDLDENQPSYNISTAVGNIESLYISPDNFNITQDTRLGFVGSVVFSNTNSAVLKMYSGSIMSNQQFEFQSDVKTFTKSGAFAQHNCLQPGLDYKFVLVDQNSGNILDAKIITIPYYNTLGGQNQYIRILYTYPGTTSAGDNTVVWKLVGFDGLDNNLDNIEIGATGIDTENTNYNAYYNNTWNPDIRNISFIHYSQPYNTDYMYMWARDKNTKEVLASSSLFVIPRKRMVVLWSSLPDDNSILKYSIFYCSKTAATFIVYYKTEGQNNWKKLYSTNLTACSSKTKALWTSGDHIEIPLEQNLRSGVTFKAEIKQENTTISANITTI